VDAKLYVEATALLEKKDNETPEETASAKPTKPNGARCIANGTRAMKVRELWRVTREWSLEELREVLKMLDVKMDVWFYESEVDEPSKAIVNELIERKIADDERPQWRRGHRKDRRETWADKRKISHECCSAK
jgi:arginyl-tRNA synthetase